MMVCASCVNFKNLLTLHTLEFLLGEDILVAPVLTANTTKRNIVLPDGTWIDGNNGTVYEGPQTLKDYPAPLEVLPYFLRQGSEAAGVAGSVQLTANIIVTLFAIIVSCYSLI